MKEDWQESFDRIKEIANNPRCLAIGESGFDRLKGPGISNQKAAFQAQAELAATLNIPLILHCVKGHDLLLEFLKSEKNLPNIIWHGFNQNPKLAIQLLDFPVSFSFGRAGFISGSSAFYWLKSCPLDRIFLETDDSELEIYSIYQASSLLLQLSEEDLGKLESNFKQKNSMSEFTWLSRTELITGRAGLEKLAKKHVLIVGLGGVGSFAAEFIGRSGIGEMTIIDGDVVDITNVNRQLPASQKNIGQSKAEWIEERLLSINPNLNIHTIKLFMRPEAMTSLLQENEYDYVVDCIDSFTPKVHLIEGAIKRGFPLVSSMGPGGKKDPTQIRVVDISETFECKLAHYVRKNLRARGINSGFKAVFSTEKSLKESLIMTDGANFKKSAYSTMSFLPAAFGCACAAAVINDLLDF